MKRNIRVRTADFTCAHSSTLEIEILKHFSPVRPLTFKCAMNLTKNNYKNNNNNGMLLLPAYNDNERERLCRHIKPQRRISRLNDRNRYIKNRLTIRQSVIDKKNSHPLQDRFTKVPTKKTRTTTNYTKLKRNSK